MRRRILSAGGFTLGLALLLAITAGPSFAFEIAIEVAPNVLNLQSQGEVVTVHTDIDYDQVYVSAVFLNGLPLSFSKEDNRGFFVAKFLMEEVKGLDLVIGGYNTLTLVGTTIDGQAFSGAQEIMVVDNVPAGRR